jgi:DNA polymerase III delta subunit
MAVRSIRNYRDFQKELAARKLASGYLFVGPESYLINEAQTALRDALLTDDFTTTANLPQVDNKLLVDQMLMEVLGSTPPGPKSGAAQPVLSGDWFIIADDEAIAAKLNDARKTVESFDYAGYQGRETDLDQVLMQIRTPPMIVRRRLVVVKDFDKYRKEGQEQLLDELAKAPSSCRLVLTTASENVTMERLINSHGCAKFVVSVPALGLDDAVQFIDRWAKQHQLKVADDAKLLLLETCGDSLGQLKGELDKIRTFIEPERGSNRNSIVTKDMVRDLAGHWREYQISEFVDSVARRNRAQALSNLWRLNDWAEEPVKIVGWLAGRYLRMLAYGYGEAQLWTKQEITLALRHLSRIDLKLKTGYPERYYLIENFVMRRTAVRKPAPGGR